MIDAKQRVIYTVWMKDPGSNNGTSIPVYCAEPSPDALDSIAANTAVTLTPQQAASLALSGSFSDQASAVARTQSVQLMRDIMFRECEAYIDGSNKDISFMTDHRRLISSMISILAIEQLTDAAKGAQAVPPKTPNVADQGNPNSKNGSNGTGDPSNNSDSNATATGSDVLTKSAQALVADYQAQQKLETKLVGDNKLAETTDGKNLNASAKKTQSAAAATTKAIGNATTTAKTGPQQPGADQSDEGGSTSTDSLESIAWAVDDIVSQTLNLPLTRELCVATLESAPTEGKSQVDPAIWTACLTYLKSSVDMLSSQQTAYGTCVKLMVQVAEATQSPASAKDYLSTYQELGCSTIVNASTNKSANDIVKPGPMFQ